MQQKQITSGFNFAYVSVWVIVIKIIETITLKEIHFLNLLAETSMSKNKIGVSLQRLVSTSAQDLCVPSGSTLYLGIRAFSEQSSVQRTTSLQWDDVTTWIELDTLELCATNPRVVKYCSNNNRFVVRYSYSLGKNQTVLTLRYEALWSKVRRFNAQTYRLYTSGCARDAVLVTRLSRRVDLRSVFPSSWL